MTRVAGVDGCRGGWIALVLDLHDGAGVDRIEWQLHAELGGLLALRPAPRHVAIDMPIGLLDTREVGGRPCDREARARLGPRRSSVFSPPLREQLGATAYEQVREQGLSLQAFHLLPRIRELDAWMTPARQSRWRETHPELAFARRGGGPMQHPKRSVEGRRERLAVLRSPRSGLRDVDSVFEQGRRSSLRRCVALDDLLDAMVLADVARSFARGSAVRVPQRPDRDRRGLRMEIWS